MISDLSDKLEFYLFRPNLAEMNPTLIFLLLFVGAPLVELYFLIEVGSVIGALPTILVSIFTAVLGGALVRMQGLSVLMRVQQNLAQGQAPALEIMEGALLMVSGLLLLLPGFITDVFGFLMLIPPVRKAFIIAVLKRSGKLHPASPADAEKTVHYRIIEGEYRRDDDHSSR